MKKPTNKEIAAEAKKLDEMKPKVRRFSMFGDDNWAAIEAQIRVLEEDLDEDEIYEAYGNEDEEDQEETLDGW